MQQVLGDADQDDDTEVSMEKEVRDRLVRFMHRQKLTGVKLAVMLEMSRPTLQGKLNGSRSLDIDTICKILYTFPELSPAWLIKGEGEMFIKDNTASDRKSVAEDYIIGEASDSVKDKEIDILRLQLEEEKVRNSKYWQLIVALQNQQTKQE